MSGSTLMYAERGDSDAFRVASACLSLLEEHVRAVDGRVVKRLGDAVLAVFESPPRAIQAAVAMQRALDEPSCALKEEGVHVRIGISSGNAVLDEGDVYGDVVNVAARLVSLAGADEIFFASEVYDALAPEARESVRVIDHVALKGRPSSVEVYEYLWKEEEDLTVSVGTRVARSASTLELTYGSERFVVGPGKPHLTIGRVAGNDVTVEQEMVSRRHAEIAWRGDKFVLVDRSTNGTYVHVDQGPRLRVVREEVTLTGTGRILLGKEDVEPLHYKIQAG